MDLIWALSWVHDSCWNSKWLLSLRVPLGLAPVALIPGLEGSWPPIWITAMHSIWYSLDEHLKVSAGTEGSCIGCKWCHLFSTCIIFPSGVALVASVFSDGILDTGTQVLYGIGLSYLEDFFHLFLFIQSCLGGWGCTLGMHWLKNVNWQGPKVMLFCIVPALLNTLPPEIRMAPALLVFCKTLKTWWCPSSMRKGLFILMDYLIGFIIIRHPELLDWDGRLYKINKYNNKGMHILGFLS